jgi:basic amino acid/polyamine antiporter, APA family
MQTGTPTLDRSLTRFDATMIVMGTIIGVGIFFQPQKTVVETGSAGWSMVAWAFGSVLALTGAFTYAALGRLVPKTGGPYTYLRDAFGSLPAFLYGFMMLAAIGSGATAVVGLIFVDYLLRLLAINPSDLHDLARPAIAAGTILVLMAINAAGVKWGSRVQNAFTLLKIASLAGLILAGLTRGERDVTFAITATDMAAPVFHGIFPAMAGVLFSFGGWQNLSNVAGEMNDAKKDLPPSIVYGVIGVAILYVLANYGFLSLLSVDELVASPTPAADALARALGPIAGDIAAAMILCSAFGIVNGLLLSLPRIYYAMAHDGLAPAAFGRVSALTRAPVAAIVVQATVAAGFCFMRSVGALTDYVASADWIFFSLNALALFAIAKSRPTEQIGLGYPLVPAIFAVLSIVVTIGMIVTTWENARWCLVFLGVGAALHFVFIAPRRA